MTPDDQQQAVQQQAVPGPHSHRIAVNLLYLVPGDVGGTEEYAVRTLRAFHRHGPSDIQPVLFVLEPMLEAHPDLCGDFETVVCPLDGVARARRIVAESTWLRRRSGGFSAVHHLGGRIPLRTAHPAVVTVHDLQPLDHPERFTPAKRAFLGWSLPRSLRTADVVVAISQRVRSQVVDRFGIDPERVVVVSCGAEHVADRPARPATPPVVVYPAVTHPHKNHAVLIEAFARLADRHPDAGLVLTGAAGAADAEVRAAAAASGVGDRITVTGRIPAAELADLLASSAVLAFPSGYEGFGIPVLEAMAAGVPAVVGADTAAADLAADAGVVVDTGDVAAWAEAIDRLLTDDGYRSQVARSGLVRAADHTWEASAAQLERAWRLAIGAPAAGSGGGHAHGDDRA